jgi:hypothetical protein
VADAIARELVENAAADVSLKFMIKTRPKNMRAAESTKSLARNPEIEDVLNVIFINPP